MSLFLFAAVIAAIFLVVRTQNFDKTLGIVSETSSPEPYKDSNTVNIKFAENELSISWFEVKDSSALMLIPNFSDRFTTDQAKDKYKCKSIVSGGFYTPDERPTGLFISNGKEIRAWQKNTLFNGIYTVNSFDIPRITEHKPEDSLIIALQSGPILKENAIFRRLSLKSDTKDRRVVAATTGENTSVFLMIYDRNSAYLGPNLEDLPEILRIFEEESELTLSDAINLDGGTASAFYSEGLSMPELSPVGSFFCML